MENLANVSSEEELLQLRNEGKISEDEYEDLRGAMQKSTEVETTACLPEKDEKKSKRRLGKIAFRLMLLGFIVPIVYYTFSLVLDYRTHTPLGGAKITAPLSEQPSSEISVSAGSSSGTARRGCGLAMWLSSLLALVLEIAAFAMSVVAWPDTFAKATVATISFIIVIGFLFLIAVTVFPI
jgi:hypothetical protein